MHAAITFTLIVAGSILTGLHAINQDTFLAMITGAVGLIGGGGTALALGSLIARPPPPPHE